MNTFEKIGEAQLLVQQGQRELADALARLVKRAFLGAVGLIARSAPGPFVP